MLICPFCRTANPEELTTCEHCGKELRHGLQPVTSAVRRQPPPVEPPPPVTPGPRWGRLAVLGVVLATLAGWLTWLAARPSPCDGKFSSTQFAYCLGVPRGWTASTARVGSTDVDQFLNHPATAFVMSIALRPGITLDQYAEAAVQQDEQSGLTTGPRTSIRLGGVPAMTWELSEEGGRFQGLEVVTVRDDVGWTIQLNDDEATYGSHVDAFKSMLSSFHFR